MSESKPSAFARCAILAYGISCYLIFLACFLYAIAFVGGFDVVPKTIDSGERGPLGLALAIDLGLLSLFAVQHSVMARPAFKRLWTRIVPEPAERPTYVLASSVVLALLFAVWQPLPLQIWDVTDSIGGTMLTALYFGGWALLLYATALIDHFDLFGLRQAWFGFRGETYRPHPFKTPGAYKLIRHPLYVAWTIIFWATPSMSAGHLLFATVATAYMALAVFVEERDLVDHFGDAYRRYQETTPKFVPRLVRPRSGRRVATGLARSAG